MAFCWVDHGFLLGRACHVLFVNVVFKGKMRTPTLNVEFNLSRTHEDVIHGVDE